MRSLQSKSGLYEKVRDDYRHPACWRAINNACPPHFHSAIELVYLNSGEMETVIDGVSVVVRERELLIVPPYSVHRFSTPIASDNLVLTIPLDYIPSYKKLLAGKIFSKVLLPAGKPTELISHALNILLEQPCSGNVLYTSNYDSYIVRGQIYTVLGILLESIPFLDAASSGDHALVRDILRFLHNNYVDPITLGRIASAFGYSHSSISHIFNAEVGCSIPDYLGSLRARAATIMLISGKASITSIAMEAGFESIRTFYRTFKKCFGMTPSQFLHLSQTDLQLFVQNNSLFADIYEPILRSDGNSLTG